MTDPKYIENQFRFYLAQQQNAAKEVLNNSVFSSADAIFRNIETTTLFKNEPDFKWF